jgi:hypothetical protein
MSEPKNPNGLVKYCSDCIYFKKKFNWLSLFDRCEYALCTKEKYKNEVTELDLIHPKFEEPSYYKRAKNARKYDCRGTWWESKKGNK